MKLLNLVEVCLSLLLLTYVNDFLDCLREADMEKINCSSAASSRI